MTNQSVLGWVRRDRTAGLVWVYVMVLVAYHVAAPRQQAIAESKPVGYIKYIPICNATVGPDNMGTVQDLVSILFCELIGNYDVAEGPSLGEESTAENVFLTFEVWGHRFRTRSYSRARSYVASWGFAGVPQSY